jgi:hypothetical protein
VGVFLHKESRNCISCSIFCADTAATVSSSSSFRND